MRPYLEIRVKYSKNPLIQLCREKFRKSDDLKEFQPELKVNEILEVPDFWISGFIKFNLKIGN